MNLRLGRVGKQEALAMGTVACTAATAFMDGGRLTGVPCAASILLGAVLAVLVVTAAACGMRDSGVEDLPELYARGLGRIPGAAAAVATAALLCLASTQTLAGLFGVLNEDVYPRADGMSVAAFLIPCMAFLAWKGLETLTRTAKLFFIVLLLGLGAFLAVTAPAYVAERLYPPFTGEAVLFLQSAFSAAGRLLTAGVALWISAKGLHSLKNAVFCIDLSLLCGALVSAGMALCVGLCFDRSLLSDMTAPYYRAAMAAGAGGHYLRADKLLLFVWWAAAALRAAFSAYAAGLLHTRAFGMRDVRPAAAVYAAFTAALTGAYTAGRETVVKLAETASAFAFLPLMALPLLAALCRMLRERRRA